MKPTGERLHSDISEYWAAEHYHRYAIASQLVMGKRVLDIASGEGYGSNFLAETALQVTGVDISQEAVDFANKTYKKPNLAYLQGSTDRIPVDDNSIDVVVSFETIEHHDKHNEMLGEIKRVLKTDGCLIISSPDKRNYTDVPNYHNPFHIRELYKNEFEELISRYFSKTIFFSQKTVYGSLIVDDCIEKSGKSFREYSGSIKSFNSHDTLNDPVYNLAICSDAELPKDLKIDSFYNSETTVNSIIEKLQLEIATKDEMLIDLYKNKSFKIGQLVTSPLRIIRKLLP